MTDNNAPEEFLEQVKQVLENLYDFPFLQRHHLAEAHAHHTGEPSGHHLRREAIAAIETLNPGKTVSVRSGPARLYNLMHLHYIGGMTIQETALELGISLRQAYRDLRRGQESVSEILWFNRHRVAIAEKNGEVSNISSLQSEVARLEPEAEPVNVVHLLQAAVKAVGKLAAQNDLVLEVNIPSSPVMVSTSATLAQQVLVNVLSQTVQQAERGTVDIHLLVSKSGRTSVKIRFKALQTPDIVQDVIEHFIEQLRWGQALSQLEDHYYILTITMTNERTTVLIVDDNEGLVDLLKRYFVGQTYQVLAAHTGADGLEIARTIQPDAIIMDLMMPGMDGWELLQRLRTLPQTRETPVIICSVINDPELAYSLGASKFLAKPVNKETILNALKDLG